MSKRYTAGVVSSTPPTVNAAGASGVFTLEQQTNAQSTNNWPPYKVEKSLRFRASGNGYLSKTFAAVGNRKIWTYSVWVKRGKIDSDLYFLLAANPSFGIRYENNLLLINLRGDSTNYFIDFVNTYRDSSAWYHLVFACDTTQATSTNRFKAYVNGVQLTTNSSYNSYPPQNYDTGCNTAAAHYIGRNGFSDSYPFDGYMSEAYFIDGQALTPSSFGGTDKDGNWSPIAYTGSYGTNGFYLNFKDVTSAATTGYDYSGNGNNWTLSGFNVSTANTSYDSMIDVPEDQSDGTANNRGNYATFNGISTYTNSTSNLTYSNGNLQVTYNSADVQIGSSIRIPNISGKFYLEFTATYSSPSNGFVGLFIPNGSVILQQDGTIGNFGVCTITSTTGVGYSSGQIISLAIDADTKTATFRVNNTVNTVIDFSAIPTGEFIDPAVWLRLSGDSFIANYGQRPFTYAPPSGFKALNTFNLPEPTIKQPNKYMDATLYTGTGANTSITNSGSMQPDFVWMKRRNGSGDHNLFDSVRGATKDLYTNGTFAETTYADSLTAFNSNGFSLGTDAGGNYVNTNGHTMVAWQWKAGGTAVTNTNGSITSQVSANPTSGFSIATYTGNGTVDSTFGHGLGVAPSMVITKARNNGTDNWQVWHTKLTSIQYYLQLNTTGAQANDNSRWGTNNPTSSVMNLGYAGGTNANGTTYVAYCFAQVAGYSAFGSYTGNGSSDGPFIYTGFRPRFIMVKCTSNAENWYIGDGARQTFNASTNPFLIPNLSNAESNAYAFIDLISNGFKCRFNGADTNGSGRTYIYAAFAETPFKYARSR